MGWMERVVFLKEDNLGFWFLLRYRVFIGWLVLDFRGLWLLWFFSKLVVEKFLGIILNLDYYSLMRKRDSDSKRF